MPTPNLGLPYIETGQAQKEVTHAEALNALDALAMASVISATLATPPATPAEGDSYIVPAAGATGAWAGRGKAVAAYFGGWRFHTPREGWTAYDRATARQFIYQGGAWLPMLGDWQIPTLSGTWISYGGGYAGARYRKAVDGLVTIEGMVQGGATGTGTLFTLLAGFRPSARLVFVCMGGGGAFRCDVDANGDVIFTGANTVFSSLAGVRFYAA